MALPLQAVCRKDSATHSVRLTQRSFLAGLLGDWEPRCVEGLANSTSLAAPVSDPATVLGVGGTSLCLMQGPQHAPARLTRDPHEQYDGIGLCCNYCKCCAVERSTGGQACQVTDGARCRHKGDSQHQLKEANAAFLQQRLRHQYPFHPAAWAGVAVLHCNRNMGALPVVSCPLHVAIAVRQPCSPVSSVLFTGINASAMQ